MLISLCVTVELNDDCTKLKPGVFLFWCLINRLYKLPFAGHLDPIFFAMLVVVYCLYN